ncbi:MAG: glycosyl transferase [Rhodobacteraceae bacterium PARR1]|nr:MAG: glycosyl transferase [Rhodobacteraceae bacterium PARR1]
MATRQELARRQRHLAGPRLHAAPAAVDVPVALAASPDAVILAHALRTDPARARGLIARLARPRHASLTQTLVADGVLDDMALAKLTAARTGLMAIDPREAVPDPRLADRWGLALCLAERVLPWHATSAGTVILVSDLRQFHDLHDRLTAVFGLVLPALSSPQAMSQALLAVRGPQIARLAETRVRPQDSCRALDAARLRRAMLIVALPLGALFLVSPLGLVALLFGWAFLSLAAVVVLKLAALLASLPEPIPAPVLAGAHHDPPPDLPLPVLSIIVALYREASIAPRLVRRLEQLDYPRDRLEILLVVEDDDDLTRVALMTADLPPWFRIVIAPAGRIRTKPRALNIALDQCRGSIVGVYDAEDAPAPDQLRRVAAQFAAAPPDVVCLQGILDFYNSNAHAMARLFTLEYAVWFRVMLRGFDRLRLVLPLGGTTLFFRRAALDQLGAWDAHNVTEDADLGIRLARRGWRTAMLESVTLEEANCQPWSWVKQRSRWIKGYMMTWMVHSRDPRRLWRDLGPRRFIGMQAHFAGSLSQGLLAPLLWSMWGMLVGLPHPLHAILPAPMMTGAVVLLVLSGLLDIICGIVASRRLRGRVRVWWLVMQPFYAMLGTLAAYKALSELATRPFYWDKTTHGTFGG